MEKLIRCEGLVLSVRSDPKLGYAFLKANASRRRKWVRCAWDLCMGGAGWRYCIPVRLLSALWRLLCVRCRSHHNMRTESI